MAGSTVVTGAGGQLGIELARRLDGQTTVTLNRSQLDITNASLVERMLGEISPRLIIHAAAATNVDGCEADRAEAYRVNAVGTWNVARAAERAGAQMVYVSTNYVFDGMKLGPYLEYDDAAPLSAYGWTKLHGERAARQVLERLYVVRTSWLYSRWGRNFLTRLANVDAADGPLRYVGDQVANPTNAGDLAAAILELAETGAFGVHHLVNEGATSWYGWAAAFLSGLDRHDVQLEEISASEFPRPASVPVNAELANETARAVGVTLRPWGEALTAHIREMAV
ncbi:MAG: dTDP-4-dehydrorhamnose reductase [Chloroflexota bacterium]|nr:dTDP-4-dehydrorhamnose reductase [Chloroflexota bacterium]MDE2899258.1 dTDP-4-dehydrorhamnose reductase [Chloroflexota bacterium]